MMRVFIVFAVECFVALQQLNAQRAPPAQPFQRIDSCIYKAQRWDDGDSFHVVLPDKKEAIFRLYFVDTAEEELVYADRVAEQAAYFGITPDAAVQIGHAASEFTKQALAKPFTIQDALAARTRSKQAAAVLRDRDDFRRPRFE